MAAPLSFNFPVFGSPIFSERKEPEKSKPQGSKTIQLEPAEDQQNAYNAFPTLYNFKSGLFDVPIKTTDKSKDFFTTCPHVKKVTIFDSDESLKLLADSLNDRVQLEELVIFAGYRKDVFQLNLDSNPEAFDLEAFDLEAFSKVLERCRTIQKLGLQQLVIQDDFRSPPMQNLRELSLDQVSITRENLTTLLQQLGTSNLQNLTLDRVYDKDKPGGSYDHEWRVSLGEILSGRIGFPELRQLIVKDVSVIDEEFAQECVDLSSLEKLEFSPETWEDSQIYGQALTKILRKAPNLQELFCVKPKDLVGLELPHLKILDLVGEGGDEIEDEERSQLQAFCNTFLTNSNQLKRLRATRKLAAILSERGDETQLLPELKEITFSCIEGRENQTSNAIFQAFPSLEKAEIFFYRRNFNEDLPKFAEKARPNLQFITLSLQGFGNPDPEDFKINGFSLHRIIGDDQSISKLVFKRSEES